MIEETKILTGDPTPKPKPKFNPNAKFEVAKEPTPDKKPKFNPNASFEPASDPSVQQPQSAFKVEVSKPTYNDQAQPITTKEGTVISENGIRGPKDFSFDKPYDPLAVTKLEGTAREAHKKLHIELQGNDALYEKKLREYRRDSYTVEDLRNDYKKNGWVLSPHDEQKLLQKEKQRKYDNPVSVEDISDIKSGTILNESGSRKFVKDLNKKDVLANLYQVDKFNELANDPDGNHRVEKVKKIAKQIEKGEVVYDPEKKIAIKPLGLIGSAIEGTMNKFKAEEEHDFFKNAPDASIIKELEDERLHPDTDEPIPVPKGKAQEFLMMGAEMPWSPMIAGAVGSFAGTFIGHPELGTAAATAVGAYENRKIQYRTTFKQAYNELRDQGVDQQEALNEARKQADHAQEIGTFVGAAQGLIGAKMAGTPLKGANFSLGYQKAVGDLLKKNANEFGKILLEGTAQGGIAAGGEIWKNKLAQAAGIKRDIGEGAADQFWTNLLMTAGIGAAIKAGRGMTKLNYKNILHGVSKIPEEQVNGVLQEKVNAGEITQDAADQTIQRINEYKAKDSQIPPNVTEEARFKLQDNIDKLNELETEKEATHKSLQEPIKAKIEKLEQQNLQLLKETEKPPKTESGLNKSQEKEATEFAEELIVEGILPDTYKPMIDKDPIGFWKMVAQQAQNRDEQWRPLSEPIEEGAVREQFGDSVVDYAKELFPIIEKVEIPDVETHESVMERAKTGEPVEIEALRIQKSDKTNESTGAFFGDKGIIQEYIDREKSGFYGEENKGLFSGHVKKFKLTFKNPLVIRNKFSWLQELAQNGDKEVQDIMPNYKSKYVLGTSHESYDTLDAFVAKKARELGYDGIVTPLEYISLTNESHKAIEATVKSGSKGVSVIQPGEIKQLEAITIKPKADAIPERISEEATRTQEGQPQAETEGNIAGEEKVGESPMVGITHRQMDAIAEEYGLPTYEKSPEKVREWDEQAAKRLEEPRALDKLFGKLRNGELPDAVETRMMLQYMGDLIGKIEANPADEALLGQLKRTKDLFNVAGRLQGKGLAARKGSIPIEERLGDFLIRDMEVNQAPLTPEQKATTVAEYEAIKTAKDAYEQKVAALQAENAKLKAEQKVKEQAKTTKPQSKKDYGGERKQIITDIKEKLRKARGETSVVAVPYAKELIAIAPDVARLVKSYVEQGIKELPELVKHIHEALKEDIPEITEKDVHNIIAGEYNEKKPSRNQLVQQLYDIKKEARLINELEELQQGKVPNNPKSQKVRNQKIEKLKEQIKELRDEMGLNDKTDEQKLSSLKARYKKQIKELEEKISKGDYGPDEKPTPLKLDKEAQDLKDEFNRLKREREIRLAKEEYENRTKLQKAKDLATNVLNVPRTVMASADFSAPLRQGLVATVSHPGTAAKAFPEMFRQAFSQKQFDRWLEDVKESPDYKTMEDSGLYIADPNNLKLSAKEEQYMTNLAEKIPLVGRLVKGSERAYVSYLNKMRVDVFKQGIDLFESQGKTFENSPEIYKALADYVNNSTGRGGLGPLNNGAQILNTAFFSPRLIASRINLLNPLYYTKLPKEVRMMALKDMAKVIAFGGTMVGLAGLAGAKVEKDPRSSDFGKIRVGHTRWDIWGGFQQYIRLLAQEITGKTKSSTSGTIRELRGDVFPYKSRLDQLASFFRGKLAPVPGTAVDLLAGRNVVGDEFDVKDKTYELFVPMIAQDIKDAWKDQGFAALFTVGAPSSFGVGVSTYESKKSPSSSSKSVKKGINKSINKQLHK